MSVSYAFCEGREADCRALPSHRLTGAHAAKGAQVTVAADLYLANEDGSRGKAIWSTHKPAGFDFSAKNGASPFTC